MPEKGTVCVIQIDLVKTLEETGDKALALSARSLPAGKYLACITDTVSSFVTPSRPDLYNIAFITEGVFSRVSNTGIDDTCAVAISPNKRVLHGRQPIAMSSNLLMSQPFMSIPIGETAKVRIASQLTPHRPQFKIPPNELARWREFSVQADTDGEDLDAFGFPTAPQEEWDQPGSPWAPELGIPRTKKDLPFVPEGELDPTIRIVPPAPEVDDSGYYDPFGILVPPPPPEREPEPEEDDDRSHASSATTVTRGYIHDYPPSLLDAETIASDMINYDDESVIRNRGYLDDDISIDVFRVMYNKERREREPDELSDIDKQRELENPTRHHPIVNIDFDVDTAIRKGELCDFRQFYRERRTLEFLIRDRRREILWDMWKYGKESYSYYHAFIPGPLPIAKLRRAKAIVKHGREARQYLEKHKITDEESIICKIVQCKMGKRLEEQRLVSEQTKKPRSIGWRASWAAGITG
ncbi:hypothetical protein EV714DRAFT_216356 [Schizophyllum commune]